MTKEESVDNSIALLDSKGPSNWRDRIDPDKLDMANGFRCILGQIYGYWIGHDLDISVFDTKYAFYAQDGSEEGFIELTEIWKERLS